MNALEHFTTHEQTRPLDEIDLIVTDVVMTGLRGTDLADRFQQQKPDLSVLFISVTSSRRSCVCA